LDELLAPLETLKEKNDHLESSDTFVARGLASIKAYLGYDDWTYGFGLYQK